MKVVVLPVVKPLISIVIPTRDRPDTLAVCLRTFKYQPSERIEIVVQDNCSGPATAEVVDAARARDPRIRYSRSPYPTSQRDNFERGLAAATGDYLSIIGDDDGFTVNSLPWLVTALTKRPVDAVRWNLLPYIWPSLSTDGEGFLDFFPAICLGGNRVAQGALLADKAVAAKTDGSWQNILVYHGMISRRVYDRMRAKTAGIFFPYPMPDVYAHTVQVCSCETYLQVDDYVSIYGMSGHSAGASWSRVVSRSGEEAEQGKRWMAESIADEVAKTVPWQPDIRTLRYHDFASLKLAEAHDLLGGRDVSSAVWLNAIVTEIKLSPWQLEAWRVAEEKAPYDGAIFARVRQVFGRDISKVYPLRSNLRSADPNIPSLRIRAVDSGLEDDLEGAGLAIKQLIGEAPERFNAVSEPKARPLRNALFAMSLAVRRAAPSLTSRLGSMPLLSRIKTALRPELNSSTPIQREVQQRLISLIRSHEAKLSGRPDQTATSASSVSKSLGSIQ